MFEARTEPDLHTLSLDGGLNEGRLDDGNGAVRLGPAKPARLPVLIVLHQKHSNPGRIGQWFRRQGYPLDIRKPRFGDPLPSTLAGHAGAVIFGGPMSANDCDDFVRREIEWTAVALSEGKPFLGVCLGAQMLAIQLGAKVGFHPDCQVEIGFYEVFADPVFRRLGAWPGCFYHWHREGFDLPGGSVRLARGSVFENQAFMYGPAAVGVQFHPEITYHMIHRWSLLSGHRLSLPNAQPRQAHFRGHYRYGRAVEVWLDRFLGRWVEGALNGECASAREAVANQ